MCSTQMESLGLVITNQIEKGVFAMGSLAKGFGKSFVFTAILCLILAAWATSVINPSAVQAQTTSYDGYLADVLCATRGTALDGADMLKHPEKHSVACLKEPQCVASGYGFLVKGKDETYGFQKFDKKGNELALEVIKKTQKKDSFSVKVPVK